LAWRNTDRKNGGLGDIAYPLVADLNKKITYDYGVMHEAGIAFRGLFLIDKEGVVQHQVINNLPLGRNIEEALRMVDALQFHENNGEVCPANWKSGEDGMKPDPSGSKTYFDKHN
jgi:peroxiredoxin (alkyl hydroperoxide reductase subunit C)